MAKAKAIPEGQHSITPYLVVRGAAQAISFYQKAFGALDRGTMTTPDGKTVVHAELQIGDAFLYLSEEFPNMGTKAPPTVGGSPVSIHLYVEDVDGVVNRAVAAGATLKMPPADMFWGDRFAKLTDPFGHEWSVATHKEDVSPEEMKKRSEAAFAQMGKPNA